MILYAIISNNGGMKRIYEDLRSRTEQCLLAVFSETAIEESQNVVWIKTKSVKIEEIYENDETASHEAVLKLINQHGVKLIISDTPSLNYIRGKNVPYVVDLHTLSRPLYEAVKGSRLRNQTNALLNFPEIIAQEFLLYPFLKFEHYCLKEAIGYVSNSKNTTKFLAEYYQESGKNKPVFERSVSTSFLPEVLNPAEKLHANFIFSRWHPQKGFDQVFFEDWSATPLHIRGVDSAIFKETALVELEKRGVHFLPWTNEDHQLQMDLSGSEIVIFPSLYEPFGLALQEALLAGCICVAHRNNSGHEEQIEHGVNGFLMDMSVPGWSRQLADIRNLSPDHKKRISAAAHARAKNEVQKSSQKTSELFEWALQLIKQ